MIYVVDIDDTICKSPVVNGRNDYANAIPIVETIKKVNDLYDQGHIINYWTARGGNTGLDWTDLTRSQLELWGCKYHSFKTGKPAYDVWIDDKAINARDF